jgi:hypothetical protein
MQVTECPFVIVVDEILDGERRSSIAERGGLATVAPDKFGVFSNSSSLGVGGKF